MDPARDRMFISPTARSLGGGTTRLSSYIIFPSVAHGVLDPVNLEAGLFYLPIVDDVYALANVKTKVTLTERDGLATAVGANAVLPLSDNADGVGGTLYGLVTMENDVGALTLGAYAVYVADFDDEARIGIAAILVGLEKPVSNQVTLMSESYAFVPPRRGEALAAGTLSGFRYVSGAVASDFAIGLIANSDGLLGPLPYIGLSYTF